MLASRPRRRGHAPLEFAVVLPLLFAVAVVGWYAARVGFTRTGAAAEAGRRAWAQRTTADPGVAFDPAQDHLVSHVAAEVKQPVPGPAPLEPLQGLTADAAAGVTDKTWDHEQFEFPELRPVIRPHTPQVEHFAEFIPLLAPHAHKLDGFAQMDPRSNARLRAAALRGAQFRALRTIALPIIGGAAAVFPIAAAQMASLAAEVAWANPSLAAWYAFEALVLAEGVEPAVWLATRAVTD